MMKNNRRNRILFTVIVLTGISIGLGIYFQMLTKVVGPSSAICAGSHSISEGMGCSKDIDCGGFCSASSTISGTACTTGTTCPRGVCLPVEGACRPIGSIEPPGAISATVAPTTSPTLSPTISSDIPSIAPTDFDGILSCPLVDEAKLISNTYLPGTISFKIPLTSSGIGLCTLTKVIDGHSTITKPLARTYDGKDWEASPGKYSVSILHQNGIQCVDDDGERLCSINLPALEEGEAFFLASFKDNQLSIRDQRADFLEMTSFGATNEMLDNWEFPSFDEFVKDQMSIDATSHREYWRERTNPRWTYSTSNGRSDHACKPNSRWRRFTLTREDQYKSDQYPGGYMQLKNTTSHIVDVITTDPITGETSTIQEEWPSGPFVLMIDGHARTVINDLQWKDEVYREQFPYWSPDRLYKLCIYAPLRYEFTTTNGRKSSFFLQTPPFSGKPNGVCAEIDKSTLNNPPIEFPPSFEDYMGSNVVELFHSDELLPIDDFKDKGISRFLEAEDATHSEGLLNLPHYGTFSGSGYLFLVLKRMVLYDGLNGR
mmetsp:Transcript_19415/g.23909  ORF Transcript_19415/g.23909 Transcript_19415/m.23909 type:complete len:544 (-) Transcript_19415:1477-3108(-)